VLPGGTPRPDQGGGERNPPRHHSCSQASETRGRCALHHRTWWGDPEAGGGLQEERASGGSQGLECELQGQQCAHRATLLLECVARLSMEPHAAMWPIAPGGLLQVRRHSRHRTVEHVFRVPTRRESWGLILVAVI